MVALVAFFVAAWVVRQTLGGREPGVSNDLLTRPWVEQRIGQSDVELDTPWPLRGVSVPLPKDLSGKVSQWTWIGHEAGGLNVMVARVVYATGVAPSLDGAADSMIKTVEAKPEAKTVFPRRSETTVLGQPAIEVEMRIEPKSGSTLLMHGIVVLRGQELIQLMAIAKADQPLADQAWARMRDSTRARQP